MIKSLLTFNGYTDKVNDYGNSSSSLEKSRLAVFDIVKNNELKKAARVSQGHIPVDLAKDALGNDIMTTDEVLEKGNKLKNALMDGWIYTLDTETFGVTDSQLAEEIANRTKTGHPDISEDNLKAITKANRDAHVMTELFMSKQYYKDGKPMKLVDGKWVEGTDRIEVFRVTNSRDVGTMEKLLSVARNTPGAGDLLFNLKRAAGSYGDDIYKNDYAKYPSTWNPNGDIFDESATHGGLVNLEKHARAKVGTKEFTKQAQELYDVFSNAVNDGTNSVFETLNGENFDWPVIFNYFDQAGVKVDKAVKDKIMANQVDAQKLISATGFRKTIYDDLNKRKDELNAEAVALYKSGDAEAAIAKEAEADKIELGITNSNIVEAAKTRGAKAEVLDTHVAATDVELTQAGLEVYHEPLLKRIDEIKTQASKKVGSINSTLYTANRAVMFDKDSDIYFSNTFGPDGNTYNPVGMEAGHTYKLNVYNNVEDFKIDGVDTKGKKVLEMEDQYEYTDGTKRRSYLLIDSDKEIQSRILDTGNVEVHSMKDYSQDIINSTTENALRDKARVEKSNWFNINSDKGFKSFENYLDIYQDLTTGVGSNSKEEIVKALSNVTTSSDKAKLKAMAPGLFSSKNGYENNIVQERVSNFINLYDDLNENHEYYNFLREAVNNKIGDISKFADDSKIGTENKYVLDFEYNKAKTAALHETKYNLDEAMFDKLAQTDRDKIIERFYLENQNAVDSTKVNKYTQSLIANGFSKEDAENQARKNLFKDNFGFEFDIKNKDVQETILGYTAISKDSRTVNQLDVMGEKGKYSRIRTDSVTNIEKDLDTLLNINAIKSKALDGRNIAREKYLKNVTNELLLRNIITQDDYKSIMKNENINPYQRTTLLSHAIYKNKKEIENIAREANGKENFAENVLDPNGVNYSNLSNEKASRLKDYLDNMHKNVIKAPSNNTETYLGKNKSDFLKNNMSSELMDNVTKGIENLIPKVSTFKPLDGSKHAEIKSMLMDEFNYTENNANLFINGILDNPVNKEFAYAKSGKGVKDGIVNLVKKIGEGDDAQGYLITAPKSQQHKIEQMLLEQDRYGFNLDELKKTAMVFKMDKISVQDGIRFVKSSNAAGKAVTQNVVANPDFKTKSLTYDIRDTEDQVLIALKNQYERGLKEMSLGNLERANSVVNFSRREMNENKSRSSTVVTYEEGKGFIKKQKLNVADAMLNDKMDLTDMVYAFDTVLEGYNNPLKDSLVDAVGESNVNRLLSNIAKYKNAPYKANTLSFEGLDVGTKLWFALNTKEIATTLKNNKPFMENNPALSNLLNTMEKHGTSLFYSKESGEAFKGIINLNPTHMYVAGANLSGASRPLINQVLNSKPITIDDMKRLSKSTLGKEISGETKEEVSKALEDLLDIKFGRSWMTEDFKNIEELSHAQGLHQGFSAKIKYMDAKDFTTKINELSSFKGNESWVKKLMTKHDGLTHDKIKSIVENIGNVTNIYEDSGAVDPMLSRVFEQRGVTTKVLELDEKFTPGQIYDGKEVLGQDGNKLYLQNKDKYFDVKMAFGYSEKAELHAYNAKSAEEALVASDIFKEISGGASVILNPNMAKHEAFNSMFTLYSNAMVNSISSDEDMKVVNKVLSNRLGDNLPHKIEKLESGRYALIEGIRKQDANFNGITLMENVIKDLKNVSSEYGTKFSKAVNDIENKGFGYGDFSLMSDNTIEKPFENGKGGAKINYRSQQAIGIFIGDDPENELKKYRTSGAGYDKSNPLQALIDSDINQLVKNKTFVDNMKQSANIGAALMFNDMHGKDLSGVLDRYIDKDAIKEYENIAKKSRVVELDLQDTITKVSKFDAKSIPSAFSDIYKGNPVNAYKIKLNNMTLENPIYRDLLENKENYAAILGNNSVEEYIEKHGIKKTVSEIYIPAMKPNLIDKKNGINVLSRTQRYASDLMNTLYDIEKGTYGGNTLSELQKRANDQLSIYQDALRFELTDSDGFYKNNLNIRSENSARFKVANVAAPVTDENGQYLNKFFKDRATKLVNDKVEYTAVQAVNPSDLFGENVNQAYRNIGQQLMSGEIDSSKEALSLIKKYKNSKDFVNIGKDYLENVGFNSLIMRDPAMLSTSYQTARTYVSNQVTKGSTWIDAVSAKWMNADGDGDEINGYYHMLEERKGKGYFLRTEADERAQALMKDIENKRGVNQRKFIELVNEFNEERASGVNASVRKISEYNKYIQKLRADDFIDGGKINVDYINGKTEIANLLSRFLKGSIGQVSNPNYYLKAATSFYAGSRGYNDTGLLTLQRNIQMLTDTTEQSLIDIKSVKNLEQANEIAKIASSYRMNMDKMALLGKNNYQNRLTAVTEMIEQAGKILNDKKKLEVIGDRDFFFGKSKEAIIARNDMAARIVNQNRDHLVNYKNTSVEEVLMDAYKVLSDTDANKIFFDSTIRQTDLAVKGYERLSKIERTKRALSSIGIGGSQEGKAKIFRESNALNYIQQMPIINDKVVFRGDVIHSYNINGKSTPGVYKVKSILTDKDGNAAIKLIDLGNSKKRELKMTARNFDELSNMLSDFNVSDAKYSDYKQIVNDTRRTLKSAYSKLAVSDLEGARKVFDSGNSESVLNKQALKSVRKTYDKEHVNEFLTDIEIIKNNKLATNEELTNFRKEMNEALKRKGTLDYRETRKNAMLKFGRIKELGITSGNFEKFSNDKFSDATREATKLSYFYKKDLEKIKDTSRYNLDEMKVHLNKSFDDILKDESYNHLDSDTVSSIKQSQINSIMSELSSKDANTLSLVQEVYERNMNNPEFKKNVLNLDLKNTIQNIKQPQEVMNKLGKSIISYGKYAGYSIEQLGFEKANEVLSREYMTGVKNINQEIKEETENIIKHMNKLSNNGIIEPNPGEYVKSQLTKEQGDYLAKMREQINNEIKRRGATQKESTGRFSISNALNKAKTAWEGLTPGRQKMVAGGAVAALALGALALGTSGSNTLHADPGNYKKENRNADRVKVREPKAPQTSYSQVGQNDDVPMSDSRFYSNQNQGLAVNVSGDAPEGANPRHAGNMLERLFGGSQANISTSYNDTRQKNNDRDVDEAMSNATQY